MILLVISFVENKNKNITAHASAALACKVYLSMQPSLTRRFLWDKLGPLVLNGSDKKCSNFSWNNFKTSEEYSSILMQSVGPLNNAILHSSSSSCQ